MQSYRIALLMADLCLHDLKSITEDKLLRNLSDQLLRAVGSIGANIAEGYSRSSGKDQARFYEYALGSCRESRDWYYKVRKAVPDFVLLHRIALLNQIIRMLLKTIPSQRGRKLAESLAPYNPHAGESGADYENQLQSLLANIPVE